ncbi:MAG TPA: T9SS type A sorting domain-containing protein, partial [Steroidobacteraceae bacterium]|nr:T9SS type A sorting domain-containing protein [Steroidobacteraceae bacterium]
PRTLVWRNGECCRPNADRLVEIFGGTQDNGTVGHGFTANTDWDWINRGDGGQAQSDPNNSNHIVTSLQLGKIFFRTTIDSLRPNLFSDNGNHDPSAKKWYEMLTIMRRRGITDSSEACAFIPPVVLDKQNGVDLYTGRTSIYRIKMNFTDPDSLTNIWKWSPQIAGAPGSPKLWYYGEVEAIALGARDNNGRPMIWTGTINNGGRNIWRTTLNESLPADSMPKWIRADVAGLPGLFPTWIRASLRDSMAAYVSFSGFNTDTAKGHIDSIGNLFRTLDGGKTWKSISGKNTAVGLPNAPVNAFVIDTLAEHGDSTKRGQCIIAAMDVGVFITTDGGNTWSQLGTGMPHLVVGTLTMYRNWLVAGTHGRSAWAIDVGGINAVSRGVTNEPIATNNFTITSVYPNPASSIIHVRLSATSPTTLELFDLKGVPLLHQQTNGATADILLPGNILTGTYILRAINSNGEPAEAKVQIVR